MKEGTICKVIYKEIGEPQHSWLNGYIVRIFSDIRKRTSHNYVAIRILRDRKGNDIENTKPIYIIPEELLIPVELLKLEIL